jgi:tetratricopeptide (TPR) repeat protein
LWGEVAERGSALRVWMTGPSVRADLKARPWTVDKGVLQAEFHERFAAALQAIALAALAPAQEREGHAVADLLRPLLPRLHGLIADLPAGLTADSKGSLLFAAGWGFQVYGEQAGDNAALRRAVQAYEAALQERTRERAPLDWAATQNNLGAALRVLGERGDDAALRRAVQAYEAALQERTRERVPLDWAATQNNLGNALRVLGERGDDDALRRAVQAFEAALQERTRERAPLDWAATQTNLGIALRILGERGDNGEALRRAVQAFEAALEVFRRHDALAYAVVAERNLARAQALLGGARRQE